MLLFKKDDFINVGVILKTHGIRGELIIKSDDFIISEILDKVKFFLVEIEGLLVPYPIEFYEIYDENIALIKLEYIDDETIARQYLQKKIFVDKNTPLIESTFKKQREFLKDYQFFDKNTNLQGKIIGFIDIPENPLIELHFNAKSFLCPFNSEIVIEIDHEKKQVILNIPEGLFDI